MELTVMKMKLLKKASKVIHYRQYKKFDKCKFREELRQKINGGIDHYGSFETMYISPSLK